MNVIACQQAAFAFDRAGSRQEQSAQQSAKILPAKRKADAVAAAPKLHDGWAKLAKLDAGSIKAPVAPAAFASAAQPLPRLPPLRTSSTPKPQPGSIPDRKDSRMPSAATAAIPQDGETSAQRSTRGAAADGSRAGPLSRLQDDDSVFGERLQFQHGSACTLEACASELLGTPRSPRSTCCVRITKAAWSEHRPSSQLLTYTRYG
jgi:hypothetical protein